MTAGPAATGTDPAARARPALVASDLDGTIVRADGTISRRVRRLLARVEAAGVPLVLVTGRPPRWMTQISEQTGHRGLAVCANGALVYDLHAERVVRSDLLDAASVAEVAAALREALPGISFAVERADLTFGHEDAYTPGYPGPDRLRGTAEELSAGGVVKLLARHASWGAEQLLARARIALGDRVTLTHSSHDGLLEVSAAGVTKASGLAGLAAEHGVQAADVIAFGDMPNDLPMLSWAGWGVAVGNAHPQVRQAADETTASVQDDGVALVLERWF